MKITYYLVCSFKGRPGAKERQRLVWTDLDRYHSIKLLEPDRSVFEILLNNEQFRIWDTIWSSNVYARPTVRSRRAFKKVNSIIQQAFHLRESDRLLDLACGSGAVLAQISKCFPNQGLLIGCDISNRAIDLARSYLERSRVQVNLLRANARCLPFSDCSFDKIIAFGFVEHIPDVAYLLAEIYRVLAPGGEAYLSTSSKYSLVYIMRKLRERLNLWPYGYQNNYTPKYFLELLRKVFRVESYTILQTDFDFPMSASLDRIAHALFPPWGRYVISKCRKNACHA